MRALSYIIALVFVLTGPSLAGSADRDMPGVGTFTYCGSPILTPAPEMMAAIRPVNQRRWPMDDRSRCSSEEQRSKNSTY